MHGFPAPSPPASCDIVADDGIGTGSAGPARADDHSTVASLTEQVLRLEGALRHMSQGLCMFDAQSRLVLCNERYYQLFGLPSGSLSMGMTQREVCSILIAAGTYTPELSLEAIHHTTAAALRSQTGAPVLRDLADGRVLSALYRPIEGGGWVSTFEDVTERRRSAARISHLARHDALTDLLNAAALREQGASLCGLRRARAPFLAVLSVGLDHFKSINDTYGHTVGDELLRAVAQRLRKGSRRGDIVGRCGGDEFAVFGRTGTEDGAVTAAQRLLALLSEPYALSVGRVGTGASVGVSVTRLEDADADQCLRDADLALRRAKAEGRGRVCRFDPAMAEAVRLRRALEADLNLALSADQFELHYQPLVETGGNRIVGVEALLRWRHPERGLVPPVSFIPIAEETGLIAPLGEWVLRRACRDAAGWPGDLVVAVNVSSMQMRLPDFAETVAAILAAAGLPARRLELEITETALLDESEAVMRNLAALNEAGVCFAMDDFGTGYSSLNYLRRFPFGKIKIDRSFMKDAETSADALAIIRSVAGLGVSLGMTTLIEGVETVGQLELARAEGLGQMQGFLFSRPVPRPEMDVMLRKGVLPPRG